MCVRQPETFEAARAERLKVSLGFHLFKLAASTSLVSVAFGVSAAYAFSRLKFKLRSFLMIAVLAVLMLPAVATIAPLFVLLNGIRVGGFVLRNSIPGVALALISGALPFAIWNLKGYLDTIPKDPRGGGRHRRLHAEPGFHPRHPATRNACSGRHGLPGLRRRLDGLLLLMDVPHASSKLHLTMALYAMVGQYASSTKLERPVGVRNPRLIAGLRGLPLLPEVDSQRAGHRRRQRLGSRPSPRWRVPRLL